MKYFFPSLLIGAGAWLFWLGLAGASQIQLPIGEILRWAMMMAGAGTFGLGAGLAREFAKDGK